MARKQTWSLDEFHGGIDLRDGLFSANQTRLRELENLYVDKGRKLRRRPPDVQLDGTFDSLSQGHIAIDGQHYTFARDGETIAHTGDVATTVETLYFHVPDYCTDEWTLLAAGSFDGYAAAWIRHTFPSATYPSLCILHVWDGLVFAPTFVQDPYLPGSFSPSIADLDDQLYDEDFVPVLGQGASKVWTASLRGNAQCSRTADARVWNQRTKDSLLEDGEYWCYVVPDGDAVVRQFIVPRNADWMTADGRWAYYVLEYNDGTSWVAMEEVSGVPSVAYTWSAAAVATRFAGGWDEIQLSVFWGRAAGGLLRLRLVAGATSLEVTQDPTVTREETSGVYVYSVTEAKFTYAGGDEETAAPFTFGSLLPGKEYLLAVVSDDATFQHLQNVTDDGFPNGWIREHCRFIKRIVTSDPIAANTAANSQWVSRGAAITGSGGFSIITVTYGSRIVAVPDGILLSEITAGQSIIIRGGLFAGDVAYVVDTVDSDTQLTLTIEYTEPSESSTSVNVYQGVRKYAYHYAGPLGTKTYLKTNITDGVEIDDKFVIGGTTYLVAGIVGDGVYAMHDSTGVATDVSAALNSSQVIQILKTPRVTDYEYAFETPDTSSWYTDRVIEAVDNAGAEDALSIASASHDDTGGRITAIASVRQRMLIAYGGSMQLWSIDQDTNRTAYLDTLNFGTGDQPTPPAVQWYSSLVVPVQSGIRSISVVGANTDNLQDLNIGEPIVGLDLGTIVAAQFWPQNGQLMLACNFDDHAEFLCLDYSRESKITAWSRWTNDAWADAGLTAVDVGSIVAEGAKLWFRANDCLHYFNHDATVFRDFCDDAGEGYESSALWHYNDMGKPGVQKRFLGINVVQDGVCDTAFALPPYGADFPGEDPGPFIAGPTIDGTTYGGQGLSLAMSGHAIAPRLSTRDESGWRLQRLALTFLTMER